jgi:hypothetical protein
MALRDGASQLRPSLRSDVDDADSTLARISISDGTTTV